MALYGTVLKRLGSWATRYSCGDVYGTQGIGQVRMVGPRVKNLKPGRHSQCLSVPVGACPARLCEFLVEFVVEIC